MGNFGVAGIMINIYHNYESTIERQNPHIFATAAGRRAWSGPAMPGVKGQPFPGKRKNHNRSSSKTLYRRQKAHGGLPPSQRPRPGAKRPPPPPRCTCTCKKHTSTRREKRLEKRVAVLTKECKAHKHSAQFEKQAHKASVVECLRHHVEVRTFSDKPFAQQGPAMQAKTLDLAANVMEEVRKKLGFSAQEYAVASLYWAKAYGGVTEEKEQPHPQSPGSATPGTTRKGRSDIWNQEWEKMHLLRAIADEIQFNSI